ncbi:7,8-dihydro-6-hydroxymethylpterin dimethyltransferase [uncultured archaeon]|nr:7,8-dihydro-6-hydroxymethylpterin dimethyltransferase [uncultured archaeon]
MSSSFIVTYSFTRRCNLKCRHCYSDGGKEGEHELSPEKSRDVVKQVADAGSQIIIFDGGEPLMRDDIYDLIIYAKSLGLTTVLGTNGTLITPSVTQKLLDAGLNHCAVSIDGSTPQTHEWLRGVSGCFENAVRGAGLVQKAGIPLQINTCLHSRNQHELQDMMKLAESLKADALQLLFYVRAGRGSRELEPPSLKSETFENMQRKIDLRIIGTKRYDGSKCCAAADKVCCIVNDGTVYPCMLLPVPLGNVTQNNLSDIWNTSPSIMKIKESKCGKFEGMELCRVWK